MAETRLAPRHRQELDRLSGEIAGLAEELTAAMALTAKTAVALGARLHRVRELTGFTGGWDAWLKAHWPLSRQTALNLMHVAARMGTMDFEGARIDLSALYLLCAPRTSGEALQQALYRSRQHGEVITHKLAGEILMRRPPPTRQLSAPRPDPDAVEGELVPDPVETPPVETPHASANGAVAGDASAWTERAPEVPVESETPGIPGAGLTEDDEVWVELAPEEAHVLWRECWDQLPIPVLVYTEAQAAQALQVVKATLLGGEAAGMLRPEDIGHLRMVQLRLSSGLDALRREREGDDA